jgi:hypothetical protein
VAVRLRLAAAEWSNSQAPTPGDRPEGTAAPVDDQPARPVERRRRAQRLDVIVRRDAGVDRLVLQPPDTTGASMDALIAETAALFGRL